MPTSAVEKKLMKDRHMPRRLGIRGEPRKGGGGKYGWGRPDEVYEEEIEEAFEEEAEEPALPATGIIIQPNTEE